MTGPAKASTTTPVVTAGLPQYAFLAAIGVVAVCATTGAAAQSPGWNVASVP